MKKLVLLSAVLFALAGCEQKQTPPPAAPAAAPAAPDAGTQPGGPAAPGSDTAKDKK